MASHLSASDITDRPPLPHRPTGLRFAIVFGESVMNDAVALVLYSTIEQFKGDDASDLNVASVFRVQ